MIKAAEEGSLLSLEMGGGDGSPNCPVGLDTTEGSYSINGPTQASVRARPNDRHIL